MTLPYSYFPATEEIISDAPLVIRRVVRWGDCDPAGIVYTPRFLDYVVTAYEAFIGQMLGGPMHRSKDAAGVDFPVRGTEIDFRTPLALAAEFAMEVRVGEIREHTFDLHIEARLFEAEGKRQGPIAFLARITPVTVDIATRRAVVLPLKLKTNVTAYAANHPHRMEVSA